MTSDPSRPHLAPAGLTLDEARPVPELQTAGLIHGRSYVGRKRVVLSTLNGRSRGAAGRATGKNAAAQEGPFKRSVAMNTAATESGRFADGI